VPHPTQHGNAFGQQVCVRIEFGDHSAKEGMQLGNLSSLDIPARLFDLGP
jgi:hypothetical protein